MKKIINIAFLITSIFIFGACEIDNYDGPNAHIKGNIFDHNGNLLRTEQGGNNMRIKMEELSWAKGDPTVQITPNLSECKNRRHLQQYESFCRAIPYDSH